MYTRLYTGPGRLPLMTMPCMMTMLWTNWYVDVMPKCTHAHHSTTYITHIRQSKGDQGDLELFSRFGRLLLLTPNWVLWLASGWVKGRVWPSWWRIRCTRHMDVFVGTAYMYVLYVGMYIRDNRGRKWWIRGEASQGIARLQAGWQGPPACCLCITVAACFGSCVVLPDAVYISHRAKGTQIPT